jgi:hypothetical protein
MKILVACGKASLTNFHAGVRADAMNGRSVEQESAFQGLTLRKRRRIFPAPQIWITLTYA